MRAIPFAAAVCVALTAAPSVMAQNMRVVDYDPQVRVPLIGNPDRSTILTFAPDEEIIRVVPGNDTTWRLPDPEEVKEVPLRNNLPMWGNQPGRTTLQVITRSAGKPDRVYQFRTEVRNIPNECGLDGEPVLAALAHGGSLCNDDPGATYGLTFTYSRDEAAAKAAREAEERRCARRQRRQRGRIGWRWRDERAAGSSQCAGWSVAFGLAGG